MRYAPGALLAFVAGLLFIVGCDSSDGRLSISGTVQFKGKPLDQGTIEFHPQDTSAGATFEGATITNGKYEVPAKKGLRPGKYKVVISSPDAVAKEEAAPGEAGPPAKERIPAKYNSASQEFVEVKKGVRNVFDYDIK
jgi:hypothetical protein